MYMKESMSHLSWTAIRKTCSSPEDGFTWKQELPWPTPSHIIRNVARACVIRLRDIGDVDSPERLVYKAWSYPDYRDEIPEEERSVGTDELDLPSLGLQREHT